MVISLFPYDYIPSYEDPLAFALSGLGPVANSVVGKHPGKALSHITAKLILHLSCLSEIHTVDLIEGFRTREGMSMRKRTDN